MKHGLNDVAFSLPPLEGYGRAGQSGDLGGSIDRVVIEHINIRVRQLSFKIGNHLPDRCLFIEAGNDDRGPKLMIPPSRVEEYSRHWVGFVPEKAMDCYRIKNLFLKEKQLRIRARAVRHIVRCREREREHRTGHGDSNFSSTDVRVA